MHGEVCNIIKEVPLPVLEDFRLFVRVAKSVLSLSKDKDPTVLREVAKMEKYRKLVIETAKREMSIEEARRVIRCVNNYFDFILTSAEKNLEFC